MWPQVHGHDPRDAKQNKTPGKHHVVSEQGCKVAGASHWASPPLWSHHPATSLIGILLVPELTAGDMEVKVDRLQLNSIYCWCHHAPRNSTLPVGAYE